jgi:hypothetical protein
VDGRILAQRAHPPTEQEAARAALLHAAREALAWLRRYRKHAPEGLRFGGEERVMRRLAEAVRGASYELRICGGCAGAGTVPGPMSSPAERPEAAYCPDCGGSGERRVYGYPGPKARRGR